MFLVTKCVFDSLIVLFSLICSFSVIHVQTFEKKLGNAAIVANTRNLFECLHLQINVFINKNLLVFLISFS